MKQLRYTIILHPTEPDEEPGYWVQIPAFGDVATEGEDVEDCIRMAKDLIALLIEQYEADGIPVPPSDVDVRHEVELAVSMPRQVA